MSSERWWWAQKAQKLRYGQLETARKQAESWRTGLTSLTALLSAVLVVKGRDNVTSLASPYPAVILLLFGLALVALVVATLRALRAASGVPGDECLLTGEDLEIWSRCEVTEVHRAITTARWLTIFGVCAIAAGVGTAWLAPTASTVAPTVRVDSSYGSFCGALKQFSDGIIRVGEARGYHLVPLTSVVNIVAVDSCP